MDQIYDGFTLSQCQIKPAHLVRVVSFRDKAPRTIRLDPGPEGKRIGSFKLDGFCKTDTTVTLELRSVADDAVDNVDATRL